MEKGEVLGVSSAGLGGTGGVMQRVCNGGWAHAVCVMGVAGIYEVWGVHRGAHAQGVWEGVGWAVQGCWEWSRVLGFMQGAHGGGVEGVCERFTPHLGVWRGVSGACAVCWGVNEQSVCTEMDFRGLHLAKFGDLHICVEECARRVNCGGGTGIPWGGFMLGVHCSGCV